MKKALEWFNSIGNTRRQELALEHFGTDLLLDEDILKIYTEEHRYYIEFDGKRKFLCLFPLGEKEKEKDFKTLEEAMNYMLIDSGIKEVTIKN